MAQGGIGGPAGGIPLPAWLGAPPEAKAYMEQFAKDRAPVNVRPGGTVYIPGQGAQYTAPQGGIQTLQSPQGPRAAPIEGYQSLSAQIAASQAAAQAGGHAYGEAPYKTGTVNTLGAPSLMTEKQKIEAVTGQPIPLPYGMGEPLTLGGGAGGLPLAPAPVPLPRQGRPGLRLQDQGEQRAQVEMGEGLGKRYNSIQDAGFTANQKMQRFGRLGNLLSSIDTGKLKPLGTELAAWAKSAGIPMDEKLDNAQAAKALSNEMALELRNPAGGAGLPGAMSDADRIYLQGIIASIDKTPGANKLLIDGMQKLAQRDREVAQLARDYKKKKGSFDDGFYDELAKFSDKNHMFEGKELSPLEKLELESLRAKRRGGR